MENVAWGRALGALTATLLSLSVVNCSSSSSESSANAFPGAGGSSGSGGGGSGGTFTLGDGGGTGGGAGGSNVSLGGSQDFGYFRKLLDTGQVPAPRDFDAAGFFAEHHTSLPAPSCGERVCLIPMLGVMGNLLDGTGHTMLQLGLKSPIEADPGARPPLSLSVVVDVSGSMAQYDKIGFVREGLKLLVDGLKDGDRFALISYSDQAKVLFGLQDVTGKQSAVKAVVEGLTADGGTNLYDGLMAGYDEIEANFDSSRQNRVILLSDGNPTVGITNTTDILAMSSQHNAGGVGLTSIGLGTDFNAGLMRDLALQGDGNYYFLEDSGAVDEVFSEELSYFTVPIAFDLKLELFSGSDYDFGRAYGAPLWKDTSTGGTLEVPSVFVAHRESASDVTPAGGRRGGGSALLIELKPKLSSDDGSAANSASVADISVSFREPGTDNVVTDHISMTLPFAPWRTPPAGYFAADDVAVVQKSFVMLNAYIGIEDACRTYHAGGDNAQSVVRLRYLLAAMGDYNDQVADEDIDADIELVKQLIDVLLAHGADPGPGLLPLNPWPADGP